MLQKRKIAITVIIVLATPFILYFIFNNLILKTSKIHEVPIKSNEFGCSVKCHMPLTLNEKNFSSVGCDPSRRYSGDVVVEDGKIVSLDVGYGCSTDWQEFDHCKKYVKCKIVNNKCVTYTNKILLRHCYNK